MIFNARRLATRHVRLRNAVMSGGIEVSQDTGRSAVGFDPRPSLQNESGPETFASRPLIPNS